MQHSRFSGLLTFATESEPAQGRKLTMNAVAAIHIVSAVVALAVGGLVFLLPKGTGRHRVVGRVYVVAMLSLNLTALIIFRLFGTFGPFHGAALLSLATVVPAFLAAYLRRPGWLQRHYYLMSFSYVGLLAATASEAATRLPRTPFWWAVVLSSLLVLAVGGVIVFARAKKALSPFRAIAPDPSLQRTPPG